MCELAIRSSLKIAVWPLVSLKGRISYYLDVPSETEKIEK